MVLQLFQISNRRGQRHLEIPPFRRSFAPVQHALLPDIEEADKEDSDINQHLVQAKMTFALRLELAQIDRPRIDENRLNIEQNEQHSDQVELYREALPGVPHRGHAAFVRRQLGPGWFTLPYQPGKRDNSTRKPH